MWLPLWINRSDFWRAFIATSVLMMLGTFTVSDHLPTGAWPWLLIPLFWILVALFRALRRRAHPSVREAPMGVKSPGKEAVSNSSTELRSAPDAYYWVVQRPDDFEFKVLAFEQDVREYCAQVGGAHSRLSDAQIQEIGEEWLHDRASFSLIRQADGSLKLG
jgi:hypothetical protein